MVWAEYLSWYRQFLGIPVRYGTRLVRIEPAEGFFRLHLEVNGVPQVETTRKIIFANGVAGTGGLYVPLVLDRLPRKLYAHTADAIDFTALRGKTVAVLGAAASAFDAAGVALESGAKAVHLFARRSAIASLP
ncbi:MAG: SidA/IucD/PvdA family monooxygenase, partial [Nostoc sp.]